MGRGWKFGGHVRYQGRDRRVALLQRPADMNEIDPNRDDGEGRDERILMRSAMCGNRIGVTGSWCVLPDGHPGGCIGITREPAK